jgi:hypothetical protein
MPPAVSSETVTRRKVSVAVLPVGIEMPKPVVAPYAPVTSSS